MSCSTENETIGTDELSEENALVNLESSDSQDFEAVMILPKGYENLSPEEVEEYLTSSSDEEIQLLEDNFNVYTFLESESKLDAVWSTMNEGDHISQVDLTSFLSEKQIVRMKGFDTLSEYKNEMKAEYRCNGEYREYCRRLYPYCNDGRVDSSLWFQKTIYKSCGRYYKILARFCTSSC